MVRSAALTCVDAPLQQFSDSVANATMSLKVRTRNNLRPTRAAPAYDEEVRLKLSLRLSQMADGHE